MLQGRLRLGSALVGHFGRRRSALRATMRDDSRSTRRRGALLARFDRTRHAACCRRPRRTQTRTLPERSDGSKMRGQVVAMRALLHPVRSLVPLIAILVAMLSAGAGLPGLVRVLSGASSHVCTCASGGTHASCTVCNPTPRDPHRSSRPEAEGAPCGGRGVAVAMAGEPGALPLYFRGLVTVAVRLWIPWPALPDIEGPAVEPPTPPPRSSRS